MSRLAHIAAALAFAATLAVATPTSSFAGFFPERPGITATVSLADQTMNVVVVRPSGRETYSWKVSTGRKGYMTPPGKFRPDWLAEMHYSKKYDNAPMPHAVFFNDGIAVHATSEVKKLGRPASHGCVRLAPENAELFFSAVSEVGMNNTTIIVQ